MTTNTKIAQALAALKSDEIRTPNLPMSTALQEASDLLSFCQKQHIKERLITVGQPTALVEQLDLRIKTARRAQSDWVYARDQTKPSSLVELEEQAALLRSTMLAAGRYNLRENESRAVITQIRGGDSIADLVQDLSDLSTLFENNLAAFDADKSIDAQAVVGESLALSEQLSKGVSTERVDPEPTFTRETRDRAFTYMDDFVTDIRNAGRYVFRLEPSTAKRFSSRYKRRARNRSRANGSANKSEALILDVVEEEVLGDTVIAA